MTLETFFEKFELFADAPGAVAKMRDMVLALAFSGGLSGKSQRNGELPDDWEEERIESIATSITPGFACSRNHQTEDGHVHLRTHNISTLGTLNFDLLVRIDSKKVDAQKASISAGDILFNNTNSQDLVGKTCLVDRDYDYGFSNHITRVRLRDGVFPGFVAFYLTHLRSTGYFARICTRWINQAAVNTNTLKEQKIPLPPLAEQKRIVAKVDELMAWCDRLEEQQQERETRHAALTRASLARFAEAPTPANLDFLFHNSYAIPPADLRNSILTLAIQGELVPQDPNDEPAEELLRNIEVEKKLLANRGGLKADKKAWVNSSPIPPHAIPESWCWVRLQEVFEISRGGSPRPAGDSRFFGGTIPWITVGEVTKDSGKYLRETATGLTEEGSERSRFINPGDLLLTNSGATLGVPKISKIRGCINDGVAVLRLFHAFDINDFAYLFLTHQTSAFRNVNQGMGQPNLNTPIIAGWFLPLPPLAEQNRIVAKVDELMALVDALETQLAAARSSAAHLLLALVAELTTSEARSRKHAPVNEYR